MISFLLRNPFDNRVSLPVALVRLLVHLDAQPGQLADDVRAETGCALADAAGEDNVDWRRAEGRGGGEKLEEVKGEEVEEAVEVDWWKRGEVEREGVSGRDE